ncbi:MAG: alpha/beta hydrolase [Candidatus Competibacterales bacterium]
MNLAPPSSLDPEVAQVLLRVERANYPELWQLTPTAAREQFARTQPILDFEPRPVGHVEDVLLTVANHPAVPGRIYRPRPPHGDGPLPVLVWLHGGGFVVGGLTTCDALCRVLALEANVVVVAVDYRLAPEHPFPAAVEDTWTAIQAVVREAPNWGGDGAKLGIAGDSAGGTLAAVATHWARDLGTVEIGYQWLVYPGTSPHQDTPSHKAFATGYLLNRQSIDWFYDHYLSRPEDRADPRFAPLLAKDKTHLPPGGVIVAGFDPLRDEGVAYAQALLGAGNDITLKVYEGMIHGFFNMGGAVAVARRAVLDSAATLGAALHRL